MDPRRTAALHEHEREQLPDRDFAEPEERKHPIEDESHARNARSRVSASGTEEEQREVRKRVEAEYPALKHD